MLKRLNAPTALLTLLALCCFASSAAAQDEETPPLYRAVPHDAMVYVQADLNAGWKPLFDFRRWQEDGAIGLGFFDLTQMLTDIDVAISTQDMEGLYDNADRLAFSFIDVGIGESDIQPKWTFSIDHRSPETIINVLKQTAETRIWAFEEVDTTPESIIYKWQVPRKWLDRLLGTQRGWGWWGMQTDKELTPPIYIGVWNNRYIVFGTSQSDVADALEQYEFSDDLDLYDMSIASRNAFKRALEEAGDASMMCYWNIASSVTKANRMTERAAGSDGMSRRSPIDQMEIMGVKQFRYLLAYGDYDPIAGDMDVQLSLEYFKAPEWVEIIPAEGTPPQLTEFSPADPSVFVTIDMQDASSMYQRLGEFIVKVNEIESNDFSMEDIEKEMVEEMGFSPRDMLSLSSGQLALISLNPFEENGEWRKSAGIAMVMRLKDEAEARTFIREKLVSLRNDESRKYFYHTSERVFEDFTLPDGKTLKRIGFTVYDSGNPLSFAHCMIDSHLVLGSWDAVKTCVRAHLSGDNLANSEGYAELGKHLPATSIASAYGDLDWLGAHAETIIPKGFALWGDQTRGGPTLRAELGDKAEEPAPSSITGSSDRQLVVKLLNRYMRGLKLGASLTRNDDRLSLKFAGVGLPNAEKVSQMVVSVTAYRNRQISYRHLSDVVFPAMQAHLLLKGDLPESIDAFVAEGGNMRVMRDPILAGPGEPNLEEEQCFVWLGNHSERESLMPAVPMAHTRDAGVLETYFLLMSDGSVHEVSAEKLQEAIEKGADPEATPPFSRGAPASMESMRKRLRQRIDAAKRMEKGEDYFPSGAPDSDSN